jgi:hypothetical protein
VASGFPTPSEETNSRESSISRAAKLARYLESSLYPVGLLGRGSNISEQRTPFSASSLQGSGAYRGFTPRLRFPTALCALAKRPTAFWRDAQLLLVADL